MQRDPSEITFKQEAKRRVKAKKGKAKARKEVWKVHKTYNKRDKPI